MVTEKEQEELAARDTPLCSSCQMLVLWIQNQLKQKATKDRVFNYVNQVSHLNYPVTTSSSRAYLYCLSLDM